MKQSLCCTLLRRAAAWVQCHNDTVTPRWLWQLASLFRSCKSGYKYDCKIKPAMLLKPLTMTLTLQRRCYFMNSSCWVSWMLLSFAPQGATCIMLLTSDVNGRSVPSAAALEIVCRAVPLSNAMHMLSIRWLCHIQKGNAGLLTGFAWLTLLEFVSVHHHTQQSWPLKCLSWNEVLLYTSCHSSSQSCSHLSMPSICQLLQWADINWAWFQSFRCCWREIVQWPSQRHLYTSTHQTNFNCWKPLIRWSPEWLKASTSMLLCSTDASKQTLAGLDHGVLTSTMEMAGGLHPFPKMHTDWHLWSAKTTAPMLPHLWPKSTEKKRQHLSWVIGMRSQVFISGCQGPKSTHNEWLPAMCWDLLGERRPVQPTHCRSTLSLPKAAGFRDGWDCVSAAPHLNTSQPHQLPPAKVSTWLFMLVGFDLVCTNLCRPFWPCHASSKLDPQQINGAWTGTSGHWLCLCKLMCKTWRQELEYAWMLVNKLPDFGRECAGSHHA